MNMFRNLDNKSIAKQFKKNTRIYHNFLGFKTSVGLLGLARTEHR